jgi:hypothetical protein
MTAENSAGIKVELQKRTALKQTNAVQNVS